MNKNEQQTFGDAVRQILDASDDFVALAQVYSEIKEMLPDLCDDSVPCPWCKIGKHPKWQHQCRWALQALKDRKLVVHGGRGLWKGAAND